MSKRRISARQVISDLHAGLTNEELRKKYFVSQEALEYIFRRLVDAGLMTHLQLYERTSLSESDVFRAFVDPSKPVLKCPKCGQTLPEEGECWFCKTLA